MYIQPFPWTLCYNKWPHILCIRFVSFSFFTHDILLEDFAAYLVGFGVGMFVVVYLFLLLLGQFDIGFCLIKSFQLFHYPWMVVAHQYP